MTCLATVTLMLCFHYCRFLNLSCSAHHSRTNSLKLGRRNKQYYYCNYIQRSGKIENSNNSDNSDNGDNGVNSDNSNNRDNIYRLILKNFEFRGNLSIFGRTETLNSILEPPYFLWC